jgi:hypothetical protein
VLEAKTSHRQQSRPTSYLNTMMGKLHSNDKVPLWKEDMVERVKWRSQTNKDALSHTAPLPSTAQLLSPRGASPPSTLKALPSNGVSLRNARTTKTGRAISDGASEAGLYTTLSAHSSAKDRERKLFFYQDAICDLELQTQLLNQRETEIRDELARMQLALSKGGVGKNARITDAQLTRERAKMMRTLEVSEERVSEAERLNRDTVTLINKLRKGRADFLRRMRNSNEREAAMVGDMKRFGQSAHASLDEKEKLEARLKRSQFEYGIELRDYDKRAASLEEQIEELNTNIERAKNAENHYMEQEKQAQFSSLKQRREVVQRREIRLGYAKSQVQLMEADFERLRLAVGVETEAGSLHSDNPSGLQSVHELVSASLQNEERNSSLVSFVEVQVAQAQALEAEIAQYEEQYQRLLHARQDESHSSAQSNERQARAAEQIGGINASIDAHETVLSQLCEPVQLLFDRLGCTAPNDDGGLFKLKGCRPDTLTDYIRLIDDELRVRHVKAQHLLPEPVEEVDPRAVAPPEPKPKRSALEVLEQFTRAAEVLDYTPVEQVRRELEKAAQNNQLGVDAALGEMGH